MTMRRTILIGAGVLGLACSQFAWATSTDARASTDAAKMASADSSSDSLDSNTLKKTASPKEGRPLPPRSSDPLREASWGWGRLILAMGIVVGLIFLLRWLLARANHIKAGETDSMPVEVISRRALSAKHSVCVVRFNGRSLLLGVGPAGVTKLADGGMEQESCDDAKGGAA